MSGLQDPAMSTCWTTSRVDLEFLCFYRRFFLFTEVFRRGTCINLLR